MIIGLTGGIASGKSTVATMIKDLHIPIIDADLVARLVVEPGEAAFQKIVETFGSQILNPDGELNRKKLGEIIFNDKEMRHQLNSIVHPQVRIRMKKEMEHYLSAGHDHVVLDIPLLFESKLTDWADRTLVVYVNPTIQLSRLTKRNHFSKEEALSRIRSQLPLSEKREMADAVIDNNGSVEASKTQLLAIFKQWKIIH